MYTNFVECCTILYLCTQIKWNRLNYVIYAREQISSTQHKKFPIYIIMGKMHFVKLKTLCKIKTYLFYIFSLFLCFTQYFFFSECFRLEANIRFYTEKMPKYSCWTNHMVKLLGAVTWQPSSQHHMQWRIIINYYRA